MAARIEGQRLKPEEAKKIVDERSDRRGQYVESQKKFMAASGALARM